MSQPLSAPQAGSFQQHVWRVAGCHSPACGCGLLWPSSEGSTSPTHLRQEMAMPGADNMLLLFVTWAGARGGKAWNCPCLSDKPQPCMLQLYQEPYRVRAKVRLPQEPGSSSGHLEKSSEQEKPITLFPHETFQPPAI